MLTTDACTLPTSERPLRLAEFDALFADHLVGLSAEAEGTRIRLRGDHGLVDRVRDLTARESACCSFFTFAARGTTTGPTTEVDLLVSVPPGRQELLEALTARAERVQSA
ncbi:hypothetical protein G5V58_13370 [Nocardioides anomalus]|uniref:Uncharacterized protein n=1 Tax=Nocardioides anomalus TaxID=2712223 RepID=A0A6G6WEI2_9ACTN|nr:hypothetical protein [Nocardioides anomalus]QIG43616.1 hypothetical protein G5V58_13370 [Nocardioides anomalus]